MKLKISVLVLLLTSIFLSSCVSRLGRPTLTGTITDFNGNPVSNCKVGEVLTDKNGKFMLPEIRYNQFLLTEIFQMEAPPLWISEPIVKKGYLSKEIYAFDTYGGGASKGTKWNIDTIRLKKTNQHLFDFSNTQWQVSTNQKMDTIYLTRSGFHEFCKSRKCNDFYLEYEQYADNYLNSFGKNNLPKGVIRKYIRIHFNSNKRFEAEKIKQYGNKDGTWSDFKPNDTIQVCGEWIVDKEKIRLTSEFMELKGTFELAEFDYEYMQWTKTITNKQHK